MCGICGIAHAAPTRPVDQQALERMSNVLRHRGPDGEGTHVAGGVGLGHRRLSIIDVSGGTQPLANEDGTVWVSFNGEIYNYQELTSQLTGMGHRFRTHSDTEVLVHAYEAWGDDFVCRLNGMFSFALHDMERRRVLLARDPLGIKPLFYREDRGTLYFASEIKALVASSDLRCAARPESVQEYLIFRYIAGSNTFFDGISRLPAGHLAVWESGYLSLREYWSPPLEEHEPGSFDSATDELDRLLAHSVSSQMMSEVPLGTYCSGGVDSGLVSTYAATASPHRLQTFAVGFRDPAWDERPLASDTARRIGSYHRTITAAPQEFADLLPTLVWYHDEPLSHPNTIPLYQLSRFARQFVTVVLTGEGADELFCGYPRYHVAKFRGVMERGPSAARQFLSLVAGRAPGHRAAMIRDSLRRSLDDAILYNSAYVAPELVARLTGNPVEAAISERRALLNRARSEAGIVATLSRYELLTYLGCALDRMDRTSMACSLEGRVPFLDAQLVTWGVRLNVAHKLSGTSNKRVVKSLSQRKLSPEISSGRKSGFGVPLDAWFRSPVLAALLKRLLDPGHPGAELFAPDLVRRLATEHAKGIANHGEVLWLLSNVYIWTEINSNRASSNLQPAPSPQGSGTTW